MFEVPKELIYEIKKVVNMRILSNPLSVSDFIDILDEELRNTYGVNNINTIQFIDKDYSFNILINNVDATAPDRAITVIQNTSYRFLNKYNVIIANFLGSINNIYRISFLDAIQSDQRKFLSEIIYANCFYVGDQYCIYIRLY